MSGDDQKREILHWLIDQGHSPEEINKIVQRLDDYDLHTVYGSLFAGSEQREEGELDVEDVIDDVLNTITTEFGTEEQTFSVIKHLEARVPLLGPREASPEQLAAELRGQVAELAQRFTCSDRADHRVPITLELAETSAAREAQWSRLPRPAQDRHFATLRAVVAEELLAEIDNPTDENGLEPLMVGLRKRVYDWVVLANIAMPGKIETAEGLLAGPACETRIEPMQSCLAQAVEYAEKTEWPKLHRLSLATIHDWTLHKHSWLLDHRGDNAVSRALSALSHLFRPSGCDAALDLFFAMLGLEALYADSYEGIQRQLLGKSEALLGGNRSLAAHLVPMYQLRSKLSHGSLGLRNRYDHRPAPPADSRLAEPMCAAVGLLVATLQWLVQNDRHELRFEYSVVAPQDGPS